MVEGLADLAQGFRLLIQRPVAPLPALAYLPQAPGNQDQLPDPNPDPRPRRNNFMFHVWGLLSDSSSEKEIQGRRRNDRGRKKLPNRPKIVPQECQAFPRGRRI